MVLNFARLFPRKPVQCDSFGYHVSWMFSMSRFSPDCEIIHGY